MNDRSGPHLGSLISHFLSSHLDHSTHFTSLSLNVVMVRSRVIKYLISSINDVNGNVEERDGRQGQLRRVPWSYLQKGQSIII